jgi:hypothetical protein
VCARLKLTKRALEVVSHLEHATLTDHHFEEWEVNLKINSDKILTVSYKKSNETLYNLVYESISRLVINQDYKRIVQLNFKELDNYLRDDNLVSSFDETVEAIAILNFQKMKSNLISALAFSVCANEIDNFHSRKGDELIATLLIVEVCFRKMTELFKFQNEAKVIYLEYEYLYFETKLTADWNYFWQGLEIFFSKVIGKNIKFVAVQS